MEKVRRIIKECVEEGKNKFIVYPYGMMGKAVEHCLKSEFQLECIVVDEYSQSKEVKRFHEIENLKDYTLLISSDNKEIYKEIRDKAGNFKGRVVDLGDLRVTDGFDFRCSENKIEGADRIQLQELFSRTEKSWKALGDEKPFWSVVTFDEYKQENINDWAVDKFYASGFAYADELKKQFKGTI
jgi:hypothetical protein